MSDFDVWGVDENVAKDSVKSLSMKHGMFASVPILCRDELCPYVDVCTVDSANRKLKGRCPIEAGTIVERFNRWCNHFKIDISNGKISDEDLADVSLIKDLVEIEVQIIRAENKIAMNADFLGKTIVEIDKKGKVYREDAVTPEAQYKLSLQDKMHKILKLLRATRSDKMEDLKSNESEEAVSIFKTVSEKIDKLNINLDDMKFGGDSDE